jgi:hypothetical protein
MNNTIPFHPVQPVAEAQAFAREIRQAYTALRREGFNEKQTFELLRVLIMEAAGRNSE